MGGTWFRLHHTATSHPTARALPLPKPVWKHVFIMAGTQWRVPTASRTAKVHDAPVRFKALAQGPACKVLLYSHVEACLRAHKDLCPAAATLWDIHKSAALCQWWRKAQQLALDAEMAAARARGAALPSSAGVGGHPAWSALENLRRRCKKLCRFIREKQTRRTWDAWVNVREAVAQPAFYTHHECTVQDREAFAGRMQECVDNLQVIYALAATNRARWGRKRETAVHEYARRMSAGEEGYTSVWVPP